VSPKYSTDSDDHRVTQWHSDRRYVLATWTTRPFTGHRHRHKTIEHRLVVEYTHDVGADLLHEVRSEDYAGAPDEFEPVEWLEVRAYGIRHHRKRGSRWWA
jgi:hypothetical protein